MTPDAATGPRRVGNILVLLGALLALLPQRTLAAEPQRAQAAETQSITFREAVEIALEQNSALERAANQAALDHLSVSESLSRFFPNLRLSAGSSQSFAHGSSGPGDEGGSASFNTGLSSSLVLFDGLANLANLEEARLRESAGILDMERTRQTVVFFVISGYLALIEAREQLHVREENLAAQLEQEQQVEARVEGGERPIADLYQQQANVAAARLSQVNARRAYELAQVDLVQALRLDPAREHSFEAPALPDSFAEGAEPELAALIERAFEQRADLQALEAELEAAGQGERSAAAGRWPVVTLSAGYNTRYTDTAGLGFGDQLEANRSGSVGLSISVPVFDRQDTRRAVSRAQISSENARLSVSDLRQEVALQVRRAVLDWRAAREQLQAAESQVQASEQSLEATRERYAAGVATIYEVTLARADFFAATSARVSAGYNLLWQRQLLNYYVGDLDLAGELVS